MGITLGSVNMQARLPEDKLDKARSMLLGWLSKRVCHLRDLLSLIWTLQFACRVIAPGQAFMQRIVDPTRDFSQPMPIIFLNDDFPKDLYMWYLFLDHWNGISLFLPPLH